MMLSTLLFFLGMRVYALACVLREKILDKLYTPVYISIYQESNFSLIMRDS